MKPDEQVVFNYLTRCFGKNVIHEPIKNNPPDFVVKSMIAVEVRRLNQSYFDNEKTEGLENVTIPLKQSFLKILNSYDSSFQGKSYFVFFRLKRPLNPNFKKIKTELNSALRDFMKKNPKLPFEIQIDDKICVELDRAKKVEGRLFLLGGFVDSGAGGWLISEYANNIQKCINEKSLKITDQFSKYSQWWLYLVNYMGWGLDGDDIMEIRSIVGDTGKFNKVVILNRSGEKVLAKFSKDGQ